METKTLENIARFQQRKEAKEKLVKRPVGIEGTIELQTEKTPLVKVRFEKNSKVTVKIFDGGNLYTEGEHRENVYTLMSKLIDRYQRRYKVNGIEVKYTEKDPSNQES